MSVMQLSRIVRTCYKKYKQLFDYPRFMKRSSTRNIHLLSQISSLAIPVIFLFLSGCQSMPWQEKAQVHVTPRVEQNPSPDIADLNPEQPAKSQSAPVSAEPESIWSRLFAGYGLDPVSNSRIDKEYAWYSKHPEYIELVQKRAELYLHFILEEAEKRQMPTEMVLLPIVESAFEPFAYSHGRAAGLWQFIPSTGKYYGLDQDWWYDGRRDVIASTHAALDYLTALSKRFDGDWELALASYNAGAGNVRKAIRRNKHKNKPTDFWSLDLPRETQNYVPRLIAISRIFKDADKLGISLHDIPNAPRLAIIDIDSQIDLAKAAKMAGLTIEEIYKLNPGFNRWATSPDRSHHLVLPLENQQAFEQQLASMDKNELVQWQRYKIRKGDSLITIAQKHNTTVNIIKDINQLSNSRIRAGKHLLIPVASQNESDYSLSMAQRLLSKKSVSRKGSKIEYIVNAGDTLWGIAKKYKVSYKKIAGWNSIAPDDTLRPGQKLVIWSGKTKANKLAMSTPSNKVSKIRYTIRKGDSLSLIADKFNVKVADIRRWNRLNQKYIQPGQTLKLNVNITEQL